MDNMNFQQMLDHCKNRMHEDLGVKFYQLIEKFYEEQVEQYINADPSELANRQGAVQAIRNLYEGLSNDRGSKRKG